MGIKKEINPVYGMTDAAFFGKFRSAIRKEWRNSKMYKQAVFNARIPCTDGSKRKWVVPCAECGVTHYLNQKIHVPTADGKKMKHVRAYQVDHIEDAGSCRSFKEIGIFAENMMCPADELQILCFFCHDMKSHKRKERECGEKDD